MHICFIYEYFKTVSKVHPNSANIYNEKQMIHIQHTMKQL